MGTNKCDVWEVEYKRGIDHPPTIGVQVYGHTADLYAVATHPTDPDVFASCAEADRCSCGTRTSERWRGPRPSGSSGGASASARRRCRGARRFPRLAARQPQGRDRGEIGPPPRRRRQVWQDRHPRRRDAATAGHAQGCRVGGGRPQVLRRTARDARSGVARHRRRRVRRRQGVHAPEPLPRSHGRRDPPRLVPPDVPSPSIAARSAGDVRRVRAAVLGARPRQQVLENQRDARWESWTLAQGFPVMGIWEDGSDRTDVNAVDRAKSGQDTFDETTGAVVRADQSAGFAGDLDRAGYAVTADDFGKVKLFNYPCVFNDAPYREYKGHASHAMCVRFSCDDRRVFTAGGTTARCCSLPPGDSSRREAPEYAPAPGAQTNLGSDRRR